MGKELKYLISVIAVFGLLPLVLTFLIDVRLSPIYSVNIMLSAGGAYLAFRIAKLKGRPTMGFYFCCVSFVIYTSFAFLLFSDYRYFNVYAYQYLSLFLELFISVTILNVTFFYIFHENKPIYQVLVPVLTVLPIWFYFSSEFFLNYQIIIQAKSYEPLFYVKLKIMTFNMFILALFWAYYVKTDKIITQHLSSLILGFSILNAFSLLHTYSFLSNLNVHVSGQFWMFGILLFIIWSLVLKLHSITGDFGPIYERILIYGSEYFTRHRGYFDRFISWCFFGREEVKGSVYIKKGQKE